MRVIAGSARGKTLLPVPGTHTRPTTDRVKESMFNILQMHCQGARVLDLFAGTGQLGIEALSRGAIHADFVDMNRTAQKKIVQNLEATHLSSKAHVHGGDFTTFLAKVAPHAYDLILLDPPYGGKILEHALHAIERFDILDPNGIILCESAAEDPWQTGFVRGKTYRYGTIVLSLLYAKPKEEAT